MKSRKQTIGILWFLLLLWCAPPIWFAWISYICIREGHPKSIGVTAATLAFLLMTWWAYHACAPAPNEPPRQGG